jgi:hypothetical protein
VAEKGSIGLGVRTADPSTTLLRSSGRDDKGRRVTFRKVRDLDGQSFEMLVCEDCRSLHCASLCRNNAAYPNIKWVAQVSLLRPGFFAHSYLNAFDDDAFNGDRLVRLVL